jgi:hypothetical protein
MAVTPPLAIVIFAFAVHVAVRLDIRDGKRD